MKPAVHILKQAISISMLVVLLLNVFGCTAIYLGLRMHYSKSMTERLQTDQYSGSETMIAKIPINLPYPITFDGYERVNGEFECNGEIYRLIKQNFINDTLYVVFIKDKNESALNQSFSEFVKTNTGEPLSKTSSMLIDFLAKQYYSITTEIQHKNSGWCQPFRFPTIHENLVSFDLSLTTPPPKA